MLTIRLTRVGKKKDGSFRVIVIDSKRKVQAGNYLEMLGSYDPRVDKAQLNAERIKHWLSMGAKTSDTVHNLLISQKIIEGKKINILPAFKKPEEKPQEAAPVETPTDSVAAPTEAVAPAAVEDNAVVEEKPGA